MADNLSAAFIGGFVGLVVSPIVALLLLVLLRKRNGD